MATLNDMTPEALRQAVADQYGFVARRPEGDHPFPVGRDFALSLGYSAEMLAGLPRRAVEAFAGISHPLAHAELRAGETVLDLGCGAGMDTLLAAGRVGGGGHVHALDLSAEMLECARGNLSQAGLTNVTLHLAPAEAVPLSDASVDAVIVNGIFNLCPMKEQAIGECYRVLRPGGRLLASEIVLQDEDEAGWAGETCSLGSGRLDGKELENWFR